MWKEVQRTRKKEVLSSHFVESSRPSLEVLFLLCPGVLSDMYVYVDFVF